MIRRCCATLLAGGFASTLIVQAAPAYGEARDPDMLAAEKAINQCIHRAASGRPWLAQTLRALRKQEGGWIGAEVRNRDGSVDLGPMQVNSWWVPRIARMIGRSESQIKSWLRDDPCFNVDAARWIFLSALHDVKNFWRAVGIYHSPTRWRQMRYSRSIASIMLTQRQAFVASPLRERKFRKSHLVIFGPR
ncbi:lytic transglycosylase domain-containing protein [Sphingobium sp. SA916]|uniref:lytic transglycosylase domain-containing protein n=1 Tax=Sphingobium sp. SA916 TaxID=1851207 RepID=UPI00209C163E|nr:lytic transglycosylase domain-containing protein [Sphingobium sp. SA916]